MHRMVIVFHRSARGCTDYPPPPSCGHQPVVRKGWFSHRPMVFWFWVLTVWQRWVGDLVVRWREGGFNFMMLCDGCWVVVFNLWCFLMEVRWSVFYFLTLVGERVWQIFPGVLHIANVIQLELCWFWVHLRVQGSRACNPSDRRLSWNI